MNVERRIVCAALRLPGTGAIICGPRHFDPMMKGQMGLTPEAWKNADQGFINTHGEFLTREDALHVALANGQRLRRCGGDERRLYSENLY